MEVQDLKQYLKTAQGPAVIHVSAKWAGACDKMQLAMDSVEPSMANIKFFKVDVDIEGDDFLSTYGIRGVPTVVVLDGSVLKGKRIGLMDAKELTRFIKESLQ